VIVPEIFDDLIPDPAIVGKPVNEHHDGAVLRPTDLQAELDIVGGDPCGAHGFLPLTVLLSP
jgi:hypothetical protein